MTHRLSTAQAKALDTLRDGPLDSTGAMIYIGRGWRRTLDVLVERGLVRYFPTSNTYRLTPAGKDAGNA